MLSILTIVSPFFVFFLNCVKQTRPEIAFLTLTDIHCLCLWASDNCGWRLIFSGWLTVCMSHSCQSDISRMPRGILVRVWWLKVKVTVLIPGHHILKFCHMPQTWKSSWLTGRAFSDVQRAFWRLCWIHLEVYSLTFIHRLSRCPRSLCTFTYSIIVSFTMFRICLNAGLLLQAEKTFPEHSDSLKLPDSLVVVTSLQQFNQRKQRQ